MATRQAILIGSQSPNGKFLPGVGEDIDRQLNFLLSPNAGAWHQEEIKTFYNPTCNQILATIKHSFADYLYVYFSGHGFSTSRDHRMLALTDGIIEDKQLLNFNCPRQLIIADSCRTRREPAVIGAIPWPEERWLYATGYSEAREIYDQCILQSPAGHLIVHATQDQMPALENQKLIGGEFSLALLESIHNFQQSGQEGILYLPQVINYTEQLLKQRNIPQSPEFVYHQGSFEVPFAIISPDFIPATRNTDKRQELVDKKKDNSLQNALIIGVIGLIILGGIK